MNVQTMQLDPRVAAIHYKDYRKKVREHREARMKAAEAKRAEGNRLRRQSAALMTTIEQEDTTLMMSYRVMAKGQRILNLASVIVNAGLCKEKMLPVLAVAQADWEHVHLKHSNSHIVFSKTQWADWNYRTETFKNGIAFRDSAFPAELTNVGWREKYNGRGLPVLSRQHALVPAIPAHLRPTGDLSGYHILWEAKWEDHAPVDPLLLRHVHGHIYTVLAQWDLTPIEQAVLEGRVT